MIYEISTTDIHNVLSSGGSLIVISNDSQRALVRSENVIEAIEQYEKSALNNLLVEARWRQPCKDCEV
jgi:hypothetical protein